MHNRKEKKREIEVINRFDLMKNNDQIKVTRTCYNFLFKFGLTCMGKIF